MHKAWNVAQHGKKDVDPEVHAEPHLEEYAYRGDDYRKNDADDVSHSRIFCWLVIRDECLYYSNSERYYTGKTSARCTVRDMRSHFLRETGQLPHDVALFVFFFCLIAAAYKDSFAQNPETKYIGNCQPGIAESYLDVGNVRARIPQSGTLFYNPHPSVYEVPKGSGINSMFSATFTMVGLIEGEVRAASHRFSANEEFWPGPLDASGNPPVDCSQYDRVFSV